MVEQKFENTDLTCRTQQDKMDESVCRTGILSMDEDGKFLFEESVRQEQISRNPKLYNGEYISLVRRKDGRYQIHLKMICPNAHTNARSLAKAINKEMAAAVDIVKR